MPFDQTQPYAVVSGHGSQYYLQGGQAYSLNGVAISEPNLSDPVEEGVGVTAFTQLTDVPATIAPLQPVIGSADGETLVFESAYKIGAVHFAGPRTSLVSTDPIVCTDTGYLTASFWIRLRTPAGSNIFAVDPEGSYGSQIYIAFQSSGFRVKSYFSSSDASKIVEFDPTEDQSFFKWHHALIAYKADLGVGLKIAKFYIDDIAVSGTLQDPDSAFNIGLNGKPILIGEDENGAGGVFDLADFWISTESVIVDGDIPEATRRKFIDATGRPVDLGDNGEIPTGTSPFIFFHSEYGSDGTDFITNRGTGGTFFTNHGSPSPIDVAPSLKAIQEFTNPMLGAGELIVGRENDGFPLRLANPGTGTFVLQSVDGVVSWIVVV